MFNKIIFILDKNVKKLFFLFLMLSLSIFLEVSTISLIAPVFNFIVKGNIVIPNFFNISAVAIDTYKSFIVYFFFFIFFLKIMIYAYVNILVANISQTISRDLSKKLYQKYLFSNYSFLNNKNSSELIRNLTYETDNFYGYIQQGSLILIDLFINGALIIFLLYFNFKVTLLLIIFLILFCFIYLLIIGDGMSNLGSDRINYSNLKINSINNTFSLIKEVKLFLKENLFFRNFNKFNDSLMDLNIKFKINTILPRPIIEGLVVFVVGILTTYSLNNNFSFSDISLNLSVYLVAALKIFPSSANFIVRYNSMKFKKPSINLIYNELKTLEKVSIINTNLKKISFKKSLFLKNISFSFGKKIIFNKSSLELKKNKSYLLFSRNGTGKSTFLNILSGLLESSHGQIYIDNILIDKTNLSGLKNLIGYVPQNVQLMNETLLYNLTFSNRRKEIDYKQLKKAIKYSNLEQVIKNLSDKLHTKLGPDSNRLSGGEKQKVAIARAIYKKPQILLFDEATSGIDFESEKIVLESILKLKNKFTIIMISHKISHFKKFDYILNINNSKITSQSP